ncbi:hypothetical protein G9A89_001277 [Geosiphon pyriformis]|nr:hypothetical protein G9A89_001277 [Geosiphon pyriformis]
MIGGGGSTLISEKKKNMNKSTLSSSLKRKENNFFSNTYNRLPSAKYDLPHDDEEIDRNNFHHYMIRAKTGTLFEAPIHEKLREGCIILDVGCGPGTWILEMAAEYPNSSFVGFDIAKIYPQQIKPKNVQFYQANVLEGIKFPEEHFDYVHMRFLILGIPQRSWPSVIDELIRVTKPGGWIELAEPELLSTVLTPNYRRYLTASK